MYFEAKPVRGDGGGLEARRRRLSFLSNPICGASSAVPLLILQSECSLRAVKTGCWECSLRGLGKERRRKRVVPCPSRIPCFRRMIDSAVAGPPFVRRALGVLAVQK
ncbi:unnamed protein product [Ectocarpus sp. 8 AP-2014]